MILPVRLDAEEYFEKTTQDEVINAAIDAMAKDLFDDCEPGSIDIKECNNVNQDLLAVTEEMGKAIVSLVSAITALAHGLDPAWCKTVHGSEALDKMSKALSDASSLNQDE